MNMQVRDLKVKNPVFKDRLATKVRAGHMHI